MKASSSFLLLITAQAVHSIEEIVFRLYNVLAPARFISELISTDRALGFAIANAILVGFGLWCWAYPVSRHWSSAKPIVLGWSVLEIGNGLGHMIFAIAARGYFPGLATAPVLVIAAVTMLFVWSRHELDARAPSP